MGLLKKQRNLLTTSVTRLQRIYTLKILRTYILKFVLLVIAVQILNLSVYGGDYDPNTSVAHQNKIGEFNQIDSLVEYVAEIVLDHKDAFPEDGNHNPHSRSSHQFKHTVIKMVDFSRKAEMPFYCTMANIPEASTNDYKKIILREINPPPPKA